MGIKDKTNILLITSDQQHWTTLGVINPKIKTPNLDRLCKEGMRFDRAYCPNPTCTPTRASLITGMYPSLHGAYSLGTKLMEDVPTVGENFKDAGYKSVLVGKAHFQPLLETDEYSSIESYPRLRDLDYWRDFHGPWYGFDHVELGRMHTDEAHVGQHYALWMQEKGFTEWRDYYDSWEPNDDPTSTGNITKRDTGLHWDIPDEYHHTYWIGERSCENLDELAKEDQPFFLWSSFFDPHPPYSIPEPWASMYDPEDMEPGRLVEGELDDKPPHFAMTKDKDADWSGYAEEGGNALHGMGYHDDDYERLKKQMAIYYGMISFMDAEIGKILDKLDELGLTENTLVVFSTDHGHFLGQHGLIAKGPFHYEDVIKVPMIARQPGKVPANTVSNALQTLVDYPGTFLKAAGEDIPGTMQSVNQLDVWYGNEEAARDHVFVENRHNPTTVHVKTYVGERYKMTTYRGDEFGELFDLEKDPDELVNLWDKPEAAALKSEILLKIVQGDMAREHTRMMRIAGA